MKAATGPFTYSFSRTYFENFKLNMAQEVGQGGSFNIMFDDYWKKKNTNGSYKYRIIGADGTDRGIDIKKFVNDVYDGSQPVCVIDKIFREIGRVIYQITNAIGLGDLGCSLSNAINNVIDKFTNVFGSFICTATIENMQDGCHKQLLDVLKEYRDNKVMTNAKGLRIVKYYNILGPKIVQAINSDTNSNQVYRYIMEQYLVPLEVAVQQNDATTVFAIYFKLMDEMVLKYNIKASKEFKQWVKEYTNGL